MYQSFKPELAASHPTSDHTLCTIHLTSSMNVCQHSSPKIKCHLSMQASSPSSAQCHQCQQQNKRDNKWKPIIVSSVFYRDIKMSDMLFSTMWQNWNYGRFNFYRPSKIRTCICSMWKSWFTVGHFQILVLVYSSAQTGAAAPSAGLKQVQPNPA